MNAQAMQDESPKILIVDDNPTNIDVLRETLKVYNYKILIAVNGAKAVAVAQKALPDLILLDINMPEMDGFEACRRLKADPATAAIPIIFLSAQDDVESKTKGFTLGAVDYITKPFEREEVIKRVEMQMRIYFMTKSLQEKNELLEKQNEQLAAQKAEILKAKEILAQQHADITDSIRYALRIQQALLPPVETIKQYLPASFVLYMPKDIVSGDFYWFHALEDGRLTLAAVDCTGHGVPGAIMSVIGMTQLKTIVGERRIVRPDEVLKELDEAVQNVLKQERREDGTHVSQDGMDVAFCTLDTQNRVVAYSGANLPLWQLTGNDVVEHPPQKYPIGGTQFEGKRFETVEIRYAPGDRFYLFSDGYADQFGGPEMKRLGRRRFREILAELRPAPIAKQDHLLKTLFLRWLGTGKQVDDVLVFGFQP
ncbi:MAG: response regulator [Bacteroidia bacterium]|nr:response regulator [Bacteroidia bacterium]MDW8333342.1 response regulator [Bacteroidia bacterium]